MEETASRQSGGVGFREETMRYAPCAKWVGGLAMVLISAAAPAQPASGSGPLAANEITHTLRGKVCTSRVGATFAFTKDGHYAYDGLWTDHGHYSIQDGAVTILLDSGIEKYFAISRRGGILYMEDTAVSCGTNIGHSHG
jgi:hypothetical protein